MTRENSEESFGFLSTLATGKSERKVARGMVLASALLCAFLLPFTEQPLPPVKVFIPISESVLVVNGLITAVLLFGQHAMSKSKALYCLACGYLFAALIVIADALIFRNVFYEAGLMGGGMQTTAWMFIFRQCGFPLFVIAYALQNDRARKLGGSQASMARSVGAGVLAVLAGVVMLTMLATHAENLLPALIDHSNFTPTMIGTSACVWIICVLALIMLCFRRPLSVLDMWLLVVMCVWLCGIALSTVFNGARYDLGFYAGRIYGCIAASFVLLMLLLEVGALYARQVETHARVTRKSEELQCLSAQLAVINDMLEDKNRQLQEASRLKSEFLANMSHELRTPLNAIIGFSEVLKDGLVGEITAEQREYLSDIFGSGQHLLALINDILDLSKIEAGKICLDLELIEIEAILANGLSIVRERAMSRQIELNLEIDGTLGNMLADLSKIKKIIYNLLSNAVKFTQDHGVVALCARIAQRNEVENWSTSAATRLCRPLPASDFERFLEISVTDNGHGIAPEDAPRLFKAFSQLDSSLARESEGTGLGLALLLELVHLHLGTVALASTIGRGSCFTVWLPWREAVADHAVAPKPTAQFESGNRHRQVALIVEDNAHAAELISMQLNSEGFQILHAASGRAALDMLEGELPNLILLDILLPDMDGWDLLTRIKRAESELAAVPVVIVSIVADAAHGLLLGAAKVLQKPYQREDLLAAIRELGLGCRLPMTGGKEQVST